MARPVGNKNKPKDPHKELEKVRKLFVKAGLDFPAADTEADKRSDRIDRSVAKAEALDAGSESDDLTIQTGESGSSYECGACGSDLDYAFEQCPYCGARLEWSQ